ncbi:MAG TPA: hypothetical protein DFS52_21575 [Myxococcales bacterium]|nr:hypothetical protein [Myxococcales bacterium]
MEKAGTKEFNYGGCLEATCRIVTLRWECASVGDAPSKELLERIPAAAGVYAIDGCHDAARGGALLYIGKTGAGSSSNVLASRLPESLGRVWWDNTNGEFRLYSDVWNVRMRWATVCDRELISGVERALICAHSPLFNSQHARSEIRPEDSDLLVLNVGNKGPLMPVVFGGYFNGELFDYY